MKFIFRCLALIILGGGPAFSQAQTKPFMIAQNFYYKKGSHLSEYEIPYNPIIYEMSLVSGKDSAELVSSEKLKELLNSIKPGPFPVALDIERWPIDVSDDKRRQEHIKNLASAIQNVRKIRPDMKFGYYGEVPIRVYWRDTESVSIAQRDSWRHRNEQARRDLAPYLDALFPSLYNLDDDARRWEFNARNILGEARKFGKPMYCYLSPQFHPSNKALAGKYVPRELWRLALDTCHELADGIIIWSYAPNAEWDSQFPWWQETLAFMRAHDLPQRSPKN